MSIEWFGKKNYRSGRTANGVLLSKHHNSKDQDKSTYSVLSIRIAKEVMKEARFVVGDFVRVGFDKTQRQLLLERVLDPSIGFMVSASTGASVPKGSCVHATVKIPAAAWLPLIFPEHVRRMDAEYAATEDGLLLQLPKNGGKA